MNSTVLALERLKALARLVLAAALGLAFLLAPPPRAPLYWLAAFVFGVYFLYAVVVLLYRRELLRRSWRVAAGVGDLAVLAVVLLFAPELPAAFLLLFVYFSLAIGLWRGWPAAAGFSLLVSLAYLLVSWQPSLSGLETGLLPVLRRENWLAMAGMLAAGALLGTVARRERMHIERAAVANHFVALLRLDTDWPALWNRWLEEVCRRFRARRALLAFRNPETDRILLWRYDPREGEELEESDRPPRDFREFLLDDARVAFLVNGLDRGRGAWQAHRSSGESRETPRLPDRFLQEFAPGSLLSVPVAAGGRLFLLDSASGGFTPAQFEDLEELLGRLAPVLANLLTIRSLITRAVEQERERIVRELHDGVAQTLASVEMQLNVYRRLASQDPARTAEELGGLQTAVKQEQEGLRRFLRTLKPVRVPPDELGRWMLAHSAQFQQETGIEVEVWTELSGPALPEGVCREIFQILREALHNVRKHAAAQHVLVKLRGDDSYLRLLVDDDGRGFPFSGTYSQRALDEQGLGPVSISERTRALGGTLTVDSTPGSGATLRVDIPLS
ncbi:sensor histidine kinase [Acidobacteriia bacterium AH_259_A11_L15]|nr:sensor histidine kinase [Acidobacteriia bacterium AH_259_A11_L15]